MPNTALGLAVAAHAVLLASVVPAASIDRFTEPPVTIVSQQRCRYREGNLDRRAVVVSNFFD